MPTTVTKLNIPNNILTGSSSALVPTREMVRNFGNPEDYVELSICDPSNKVLYYIVPFRGYKVPGNFQPGDVITVQDLNFDPSTDLSNFGISYGKYNLYYNILRPKVVLDFTKSIFIKDISADRTELRLVTNNISKLVLEQNLAAFISERGSNPYFKEFYLNFGNNKLIPAVNIAYDPGVTTNTTVTPYSILIKLLNPLPLIYKVNDTLNIVDKISNTIGYTAETYLEPTPAVFPTLRGPNFDLDLDNLRVGPTPYFNFNQITSSQATFGPL